MDRPFHFSVLRYINWLCLLILFLSVIQTQAQYDSIYVDGRWRTFLVHLPPEYGSAQDTLFSLILAMHGGFGSAYNMENQSQLSAKADTAANPFIVVYPEGVKSPSGIRTWNAGDCCGYARDNDIDDVHFISVLIDTLLNRYAIDYRRVYATGMSNGGMMSYRLAAELTLKLAAIAPVASSMTLDGPWTPSRPMPIIHFHSYQDENVPYYGGVGNGFSDHYNPPVDSVLNVWAGLNGCTVNNDTVYHETGEYLFKVWTQCDNDADIHLYVTYDGGHSWPGGEKGSIFGDPPSEKINADDLMWSFFLQHPAEGNTSVLPNTISDVGTFRLWPNYPNPFNPETVIRYTLSGGDNSPVEVRLAVYDVLGRFIKTLVKERQLAGTYSVSFNAGNLPSGVYYLRLEAGKRQQVRKMVLMR